MATEILWTKQTEVRSERIASIGLLLIGAGCLAAGHWWPAMGGANILPWIGVAFLALFVVGMVFRARSKIEINGHKREIYCHSSNRFRSKVRTYSFPDLVRVDLQTYKVPEEQPTACLSLVFRDGRRVVVPEVTFHNVQLLAQEIVTITGATIAEKHSDTSFSLFGRR